MHRHHAALLVMGVLLISAAGTADGDEPRFPMAEQFLLRGELPAGEEALLKHLAANPDDDLERFGLATLQVLQAVERFGQSLYRYGGKSPATSLLGLVNGDLGNLQPLPIFQLPVPKNPQPENIDADQARAIIERFSRDLAKADGTLAQITDPNLRMPLHFAMIALNFNGDDMSQPEEKLWRIYNAVAGGRRAATREGAEQFIVIFDKTDAHWLRGYCNLLMALCNISLAYDWSELFEKTGHRFFENVDSPYRPVTSVGTKFVGLPISDMMDEIAMYHLMRMPLKQPLRLALALDQLQTMIRQSRLTWESAALETDDEREWIPNPRQQGVIPGVRVTREMIDQWHVFLDEAQSILEGETLIPFWRTVPDDVGVNLRRVFTQPDSFDLVLWVHGSAAVPYLEQGKVSSAETWRRFQTTFGGRFIGFAVWFN